MMVTKTILCLLVALFVLDIIVILKFEKEMKLLRYKLKCEKSEINLLKHNLDLAMLELDKEIRENRWKYEYSKKD